MALLYVEYDMEVRYAQPALRTYFTMKCTPADDMRQKCLRTYTEISPAAEKMEGKDAFGNRQIYGCISGPHDRFLFHMRGEVETGSSPWVEGASSSRSGIYRYPFGKCRPFPGAEEFLLEVAPERHTLDYDRSLAILHAMQSRLVYRSGSTTVHTTAGEAWEKGCGVCQDYAHVFITLLRMAGIPARYVCGFVSGEGESHAWAEALCRGTWIGLDPTRDGVITDQYIKLGHGRDAADCAINRGILWGGGAQEQTVSARVVQ